MHPWTFVSLAFFAVCAFAQQNVILIPAGESTLQVTAGQPLTINWDNPSSGTVTIKLQLAGNGITPTSGYILAAAVPASQDTATFTIPSGVTTALYTIEIIDDTNPNNYNFSPNFGIIGATATGTAVVASTDSASAAATSGGSTMATTGTATATASASNSSGSVSATLTTMTSSAPSTASQTQSTSAPKINAAMPLKIHGGLLAVLIGGAAML